MDMTIQYKGKNEEENRDHPQAWIWYDEDNKVESQKADKLIDILESNGWRCFNEEGFTVIHLYLGRDEYDDLLWDYKEAKKAVKLR